MGVFLLVKTNTASADFTRARSKSSLFTGEPCRYMTRPVAIRPSSTRRSSFLGNEVPNTHTAVSVKPWDPWKNSSRNAYSDLNPDKHATDLSRKASSLGIV